MTVKKAHVEKLSVYKKRPKIDLLLLTWLFCSYMLHLHCCEMLIKRVYNPAHIDFILLYYLIGVVLFIIKY